LSEIARTCLVGPRLSVSKPRVLVGWQTHAVNCQGTVPVVGQRMHGLCSVRFTIPRGLFPDAQNKTLAVRLHHLTQAANEGQYVISAMNSTLPRPCSQARTCASFTKSAYANFLGGQQI